VGLIICKSSQQQFILGLNSKNQHRSQRISDHHMAMENYQDIWKRGCHKKTGGWLSCAYQIFWASYSIHTRRM